MYSVLQGGYCIVYKVSRDMGIGGLYVLSVYALYRLYALVFEFIVSCGVIICNILVLCN